MTTVRASSRTQELVVRGVRYSVRRWGRDDARPIVFLHGTRDSSITFQFVVDRLEGDWCVVAPDWRGHGRSQWVSQGYWFHEFVADLDALLDALFPGMALPLVGHSLGGNIAGIYAGTVPDRVSHLVSLDGLGPLTSLVPVDARKLMVRLLSIPKKRRDYPRYADVGEVAGRLMAANPRLDRDRAMFLAEHSTLEEEDGRRRWRFDPDHQTTLPTFHSLDEWGDVWSHVVAPTIWLVSEDRRPFAPTSVPGEMERRAAMMPQARRVLLPGTGHNLHHDAPEVVASLVERFLADPDGPLPDHAASLDGAPRPPVTAPRR